MPPNAKEITGLCLLKVSRVPPQLKPVDFSYRVETDEKGGVRVFNKVFPCDEIGIYATVQEDVESAKGRASIIHPYVRKGIVSAVSWAPGREDIYFLDVAGFFGYSGGPVYFAGTMALFLELSPAWKPGSSISMKTALRKSSITYWRHGVRAVRVSSCIQELLGRGETLRFIEPVTGERFTFSYKTGKTSIQD